MTFPPIKCSLAAPPLLPTAKHWLCYCPLFPSHSSSSVSFPSCHHSPTAFLPLPPHPPSPHHLLLLPCSSLSSSFLQLLHLLLCILAANYSLGKDCFQSITGALAVHYLLSVPSSLSPIHALRCRPSPQFVTILSLVPRPYSRQTFTDPYICVLTDYAGLPSLSPILPASLFLRLGFSV